VIKVESDMLVLDSSFTKDDVLAINEFVEISKRQERERIIKLIRDRVAGAKEYGKTGRITAMQRDVVFEDLEAISEAIVYGINKESK
jgi:hypothetical protein